MLIPSKQSSLSLILPFRISILRKFDRFLKKDRNIPEKIKKLNEKFSVSENPTIEVLISYL